LYFTTTERLYSGPKILFNASPDAFVNSAVQISNISPAYAPKGQHLLSVTTLGAPELSDADLAARCREDMVSWFPGKDLTKLRHLATYRIRFAQFHQAPGVFAQLPSNVGATGGVFLAGEYTCSSGIHGAMLSGERAADETLKWLATAAD
ncbi:MAG: FAD-dependent oxidoreductase, partial [Chloroflexota bacterium]|nr:FAD-dependent oxidoreductase [Chloroflexota bacterium]